MKSCPRNMTKSGLRLSPVWGSEFRAPEPTYHEKPGAVMHFCNPSATAWSRSISGMSWPAILAKVVNSGFWKRPYSKNCGKWLRKAPHILAYASVHKSIHTRTHICSYPHRQHKKELWRVLFSYIHLLSVLTTADRPVHLNSSLLPWTSIWSEGRSTFSSDRLNFSKPASFLAM